MSRFENGCYRSRAGIELAAKILAGRCGLEFTRAAVGKGCLPEGKTPAEMTEPPDHVMDAQIVSVTIPRQGQCQITVQINSENVQNAFYASSIILYAEDPDIGEVPYTYLLLENDPEYIRASSSPAAKIATFDITAAADEITKVSARADPDSFATAETLAEEILKHNISEEAHANILNDVSHFKVIRTRIRSPEKPDYGTGGGGEELAVMIIAEPYSGTAEVTLIYEDTEYDSNITADAQNAHEGEFIIIKEE